MGTRAAGPDRLALAVLGVDDLLDALGLDPTERLAWAAAAAPPAKVTASAYRERSGALRRRLSGEVPEPVRRALEDRRSAVAAAGRELRRLEADGALSVPLPLLGRSLAHLHCNRLGVDPAAERIVLGLLRRTLDSLRATRTPVPEGRTVTRRARTGTA